MRKRTVIILKGIAVIVVILGLIYAIAVAVSSAKLRRVYADLEKAGRPMKAADIIPPKVPDTENAALLYERAGLLLKAQPAPNGNLLEYAGGGSKTFVKESLSPEKLAELQPLIEQDAVAIVTGGQQRPDVLAPGPAARGAVGEGVAGPQPLAIGPGRVNPQVRDETLPRSAAARRVMVIHVARPEPVENPQRIRVPTVTMRAVGVPLMIGVARVKPVPSRGMLPKR